MQGLNHIGPILMEFGNDAQKKKHLPPIVEGSVIWAQGYSEPGAGSDLASVATRATLNGDHFVVKGSKISDHLGAPFAMDVRAGAHRPRRAAAPRRHQRSS